MTRGTVAMGIVMAGGFAWMMAGTFLSVDGTADAAPHDLCALIAPREMSAAVPLAQVAHRTDPRLGVLNRAECTATSGDGAANGGRGDLVVVLERHGTTRYGSGWAEAREAFDWSREYAAGDGGAPRAVPDLGQGAFAESGPVDAEGGAGARAEVTVLLGRDVLSVSYTAEPSTPELAERTARAVAATVLADL
ncbi:hypothetical protein LG943_10055 [Streptomonospora sp. S1-112]|uniref:DUF3558 domain-containing protein n=1 Tax=Streptomonospora mangrovi TaxID=2883123 RepID=A0A9X3NJ33_9ACTN|nr:hypothetical protein [Streptomonospora mangrovi]MDA0564667.1 hypothetical protein [Streptomonospora mangrovi]